MSVELSSDYGERLKKALEKILPPQLLLEERIKALIAYSEELFFWNEKINLVGDLRSHRLEQKEKEDLFIHRHLVDSLSALPLLLEKNQLTGLSKKKVSAVDVGSGAGLPGIPLAIFTPDWEWSFIERSGKRCSFLRNVIALCGLSPRVFVDEGELAQKKRLFSVVVFRAFRPLPLFFDALFLLLEEEGWIFAYKGKKTTVLKEIDSLKEAIHKGEFEIAPLLLGEEERTLFCFQKKK